MRTKIIKSVPHSGPQTLKKQENKFQLETGAQESHKDEQISVQTPARGRRAPIQRTLWIFIPQTAAICAVAAATTRLPPQSRPSCCLSAFQLQSTPPHTHPHPLNVRSAYPLFWCNIFIQSQMLNSVRSWCGCGSSQGLQPGLLQTRGVWKNPTLGKPEVPTWPGWVPVSVHKQLVLRGVQLGLPSTRYDEILFNRKKKHGSYRTQEEPADWLSQLSITPSLLNQRLGGRRTRKQILRAFFSFLTREDL